jgi:hypothetical protein
MVEESIICAGEILDCDDGHYCVWRRRQLSPFVSECKCTICIHPKRSFGARSAHPAIINLRTRLPTNCSLDCCFWMQVYLSTHHLLLCKSKVHFAIPGKPLLQNIQMRFLHLFLAYIDIHFLPRSMGVT